MTRRAATRPYERRRRRPRTLVLVLGAGLRRPGSAAADPRSRPARKLAKRHHEDESTRPACRSDREPAHRRPVPLGRRLAGGRLRLLRPRPVRVRRSGSPSRTAPRPVRAWAPDLAWRTARRRPRLLLGARACRHLRRRREVHPRAPARHDRPLVAALVARELLRRARLLAACDQSGLQPLPLRAAKICRWWAFAWRSRAALKGPGAPLSHITSGVTPGPITVAR